MKEDDVPKLAELTNHDHNLSEVEVEVNKDRTTYSPEQATKIPVGESLVTFTIPRTVDMVHFWGELSRALNSDSTVPAEKKG